jgi:hypothetical protein
MMNSANRSRQLKTLHHSNECTCDGCKEYWGEKEPFYPKDMVCLSAKSSTSEKNRRKHNDIDRERRKKFKPVTGVCPYCQGSIVTIGTTCSGCGKRC